MYKKANYIYEEQENIYSWNEIPTYIILVDKIDEEEEDLETCAKEIINYISEEFNITLNRSIITLFSLTTNRIRIQPLNIINNIFSSDICNQIINNLENYMVNLDYYNAIIKLIEDIDYYYNFDDNKNKPSYEIFGNILNAIQKEYMKIPENKMYFIYDDQQTFHKETLEKIYEKQENLFNETGISNYIILIHYIDFIKENLHSSAAAIINYISR